MKKEIDSWNKAYSESKCMNCGSTNMSKWIPSHSSWMQDYECEDCNSHHNLNIGDSMGGQPSLITYDIIKK